jgi:hypothetical protein
MPLKRRVQRLEKKLGAFEYEHDMIVLSYASPGPNGPISRGPQSAYILKGQNAGTELNRGKDESAEAFEARCDATLRCAS